MFSFNVKLLKKSFSDLWISEDLLLNDVVINDDFLEKLKINLLLRLDEYDYMIPQLHLVIPSLRNYLNPKAVRHHIKSFWIPQFIDLRRSEWDLAQNNKKDLSITLVLYMQGKLFNEILASAWYKSEDRQVYLDEKFSKIIKMRNTKTISFSWDNIKSIWCTVFFRIIIICILIYVILYLFW